MLASRARGRPGATPRPAAPRPAPTSKAFSVINVCVWYSWCAPGQGRVQPSRRRVHPTRPARSTPTTPGLPASSGTRHGPAPPIVAVFFARNYSNNCEGDEAVRRVYYYLIMFIIIAKQRESACVPILRASRIPYTCLTHGAWSIDRLW